MLRSTGKQSGEFVDSVLKRSLAWHYLNRNLTWVTFEDRLKTVCAARTIPG